MYFFFVIKNAANEVEAEQKAQRKQQEEKSEKQKQQDIRSSGSRVSLHSSGSGRSIGSSFRNLLSPRRSTSGNSPNSSPQRVMRRPFEPSRDQVRQLWLKDLALETELLEEIGRGGTARVYRGSLLGLSFAVKVWEVRFIPVRDRERFEREVKILSSLQHR